MSREACMFRDPAAARTVAVDSPSAAGGAMRTGASSRAAAAMVAVLPLLRHAAPDGARRKSR